MARSENPKPNKLRIVLHDIRGNVENVETLRFKIAECAMLATKQIVVDETETVSCGYRFKTYEIKSTKKVSFTRWEVCNALVEGIRGV